MVSYLDLIGLSYLWNEITSLFYKKGSVDSISTFKTATKYGYDKSIETFSGIVKGNCYVGAGLAANSVYGIDEYKHENFDSRNKVNVTCNSNYIFIIYPSDTDFNFDITLNGMSIPISSVDSTTINGYNIIKSTNTYTGTLAIKL